MDEAVSTLKASELRFGSTSKNVLGVLGLGYGSAKAIFLNGFCYKKTKAFVKENYEGVQLVAMGRNADYTRVMKSVGQFQVFCESDWGKLEKQLYANIRKACKVGLNVIVFGREYDEDRAGQLQGIEVHKVYDAKSATDYAKNCFGQSGSVTFSDWDYSVGMDWRMQTNARVFACYPDIPDVEEMMQCLGRGARDMSTNLGAVFIVKEGGSASSIKDGLIASEGFDWEEGAHNLRAVDCMKKMSIEDRAYGIANLPKNWICTRNDFFARMNPNWVKRLTALMEGSA